METEGALDETEKNANEAFSEQHRSNCALRSDLAKEVCVSPGAQAYILSEILWVSDWF